MIGDVAGIICDGAGSACSMKVSTCASAAVKAALMATSDLGVTAHEGIIGVDAEQTIANLGQLCREGMQQTDQQIIAIMRGKQIG